MYVVRVADNFHYMDDGEAYVHGEFLTWEEAVAAAREIVDRSLDAEFRSGISAEQLFGRYTSFGDDPYIVPVPEGQKFSGWDYAKERCAVICG